MEYLVNIDNKNQVVICTCSGVLDVPTTAAMTREARKTAYDRGYCVLYDVRNVSLGVGIVDAYNFARDFENIYEDIKHRSAKAAIVYRTDKDFWKFLEITAQNAGVTVLRFLEIEEALEWLSGN